MTSKTSEFAELFSETAKVRIKKTAAIMQALAIFGVLYVSGAVTGYWIATWQAKQEDITQEQAHQAEIQRLTDAYKTSLDYLTRQVKETATAVNAAANTVDAAAQTADAAATKATDAAQTAKRASTAASAATRAADRVPEPTRDQINRNVQRANSGIKP